MFYIYCLLNKTTDKVYIGQTRSEGVRFKQHRWQLRRNNHTNKHLQNAWNRDGEQAFDFFIIGSYTTQEEVDEAEKLFIGWYQGAGISYNVMSGGERIFDRLPETREKIRLAKLGLPASAEAQAALAYGRKIKKGSTLSEEHKQKLSEAHTGKTLSEEHKAKLSKAFTDREFTEEWKQKISEGVKGNQNWLGKHHTEATKQKLSEARKGEGNPMFGKSATEETKRKLSEVRKGRPGKPHSEETKQKLRQARANQVMKPMSEETKEKIRQKNLERTHSEEWKQQHPKKPKSKTVKPSSDEPRPNKYGHPQSEETKQKLREIRAKQVMQPRSEETKEKIRQTLLARKRGTV
ncbi:MAG TPA: NUMOD3 domain-containing DNA-binding protein [Chthonomonadaceae bacterium]|nr:NUMOD3 domain-containing DNA-binding protein [Chthonomonadaceae bacterium]